MKQGSFNNAEHALWHMLWKRDVNELKKFVDSGYDITCYDNTILKYACFQGFDEIVEYLLTLDEVDPSAGNNYCLYYSVYRNHLDIFKMLLADDRVDPSANNNFILGFAASINYERVIKELLKDYRVVQKLTNSDIEYYDVILDNLKEIMKLDNKNEVKKILNFI